MSTMDEYRRIFGENPFARKRRRPRTVRVTTAVDGIMTELDVDVEQWENDRHELAHQVRLLQDTELARLVELIGTDPAELQVYPRGVARAIVRELYERTSRLMEATEEWSLGEERK